MKYISCLRPGPNGEAIWLPDCKIGDRPQPSEAQMILRGADYRRKPRPARAHEQCLRMTHHLFRAVEPEADAGTFANLAFRSERRANGDVAVYAPVILSVASAEDIFHYFTNMRMEGFIYSGWEYAAVSGCR